MSSVINPVTIDEVNANLLQRLNELIHDADTESILAITEAVAKLNSSWKGNDKLANQQEGYGVSYEQVKAMREVLDGEVS